MGASVLDGGLWPRSDLYYLLRYETQALKMRAALEKCEEGRRLRKTCALEAARDPPSGLEAAPPGCVQRGPGSRRMGGSVEKLVGHSLFFCSSALPEPAASTVAATPVSRSALVSKT